jgi:hypothetical protein
MRRLIAHDTINREWFASERKLAAQCGFYLEALDGQQVAAATAFARVTLLACRHVHREHRLRILEVLAAETLCACGYGTPNRCVLKRALRIHV